MTFAILAVAVALSPCSRALPLDGPPQRSGEQALAPLLDAEPSDREPRQPAQPDPSSMAGFDEHLASENPTDLQRLAELSAYLANGGAPSRTDVDWARQTLKRAISRQNVERAKRKLVAQIRAQGLSDAFSGEQMLPANAPDSRIEPFVDMELRAAREAARGLLDRLDALR